MIRPDLHARFESIREKVDREVAAEDHLLANLRGSFTRESLKDDDDAFYSVSTERRKKQQALQRSRSRGGLRARGTRKASG